MEAQIKQIFQADRKFFRVTDCLIGINYCMFNFDALCRKFPVTKKFLLICQFIDSSTPFSGAPRKTVQKHLDVKVKLPFYGRVTQEIHSFCLISCFYAIIV